MENWSVGKRGVEKAEAASVGKDWSGGAGTVAAEKEQAGETALDWREMGSAGLEGAGTEPDLGAYAAGGSWGWAERVTPSVAEGVAADRPAGRLLPLPPGPGGAGPAGPRSLAAGAACAAASGAAAAVAGGQGSPGPGVAETGCGWPAQARLLAPLPAAAAAAAASSAAASECLGTAPAWCCDSCSSAEPGGSSPPWAAGAAAVALAAVAGRPSGRPPAWDSSSAWRGWSGPPAGLAWRGAAALAGPGARRAARGGAADWSWRTWQPAA